MLPSLCTEPLMLDEELIKRSNIASFRKSL